MVPDDLETICFSICEVKWKNIWWNFRTEKLINWYDYYFFVCGCLFATFHIEKVIASKQMFPVSLALAKKKKVIIQPLFSHQQTGQHVIKWN